MRFCDNLSVAWWSWVALLIKIMKYTCFLDRGFRGKYTHSAPAASQFPHCGETRLQRTWQVVVQLICPAGIAKTRSAYLLGLAATALFMVWSEGLVNLHPQATHRDILYSTHFISRLYLSMYVGVEEESERNAGGGRRMKRGKSIDCAHQRTLSWASWRS